MENVWEVRQGQGEQGELLADQHEEDGDKGGFTVDFNHLRIKSWPGN